MLAAKKEQGVKKIVPNVRENNVNVSNVEDEWRGQKIQKLCRRHMWKPPRRDCNHRWGTEGITIKLSKRCGIILRLARITAAATRKLREFMISWRVIATEQFYYGLSLGHKRSYDAECHSAPMQNFQGWWWACSWPYFQTQVLAAKKLLAQPCSSMTNTLIYRYTQYERVAAISQKAS